MKTSLLVFVAAIFATLLNSPILMAQNTSPYWSLAGNINATSSSKLGTTNAIPLRIFTTNSERIRINTSGLVGIGTTAPNSRLHVNASLGQQAIRAQVNGTTKFLVHDKGGVAIGSGDVPPANGLYVLGSAGIGTTAPEGKLHVFKGSAGTVTAYGNPTLVVENSTNNYVSILAPNAAESGIFFGNPTSNINGGIVYNNAAVPSGLDFRVNGNQRKMVLTNAGKLGIGITSPVAEAHIVHDFGSISHGLRLNQVSSVTNSFWNFYVQSTGDLELATQNGIKGIFRASDGVYSPSDKALKKNFERVQNILPKIMQLDIQKYNFIEENDQSPKHYGMMAQDVVKLFPEMVLHSKFDGDKDTWLMNYSTFGILAVKAIQEQQPIIEEQKQEIATLKERINKLEAALQSLANKGNVPNAIVNTSLEQNKPNPFTKNTIIRYSIPQGSTGQINIYDKAGKLVNTFNANAGGQLQVGGHELAAGTYTYTLMVDGKVASSKQMLIVK
jgi:hypothetical protein